MRIEAFIFDFNGVLVNDEPVHCYGFQQALREEGLELTLQEYYEKYLPFDDYNFFARFLAERGQAVSEETIRRLMKLKSQHYFQAIRRQIPALAPSIDFVRRLPDGVLLAIASGAARVEIEFILDDLKLKKRFTSIVTAEDVVNGKPHPEAFLKARAGLQEANPALDAAHIVVIEDSYPGVRSAHAAGMKCVALTTSYPADRLAEADLVLDSLSGWTVESLAEALGSR